MFDLMIEHLTHSLRELFKDYGIQLQRSEHTTFVPPSAEVSGVSIIGYAGEFVRGALVMTASEHATRAWLKAAGVSEGECGDTLGEFSNMLLGRLKAHLLDEGFSILLATPTTASGSSFRLSVPPAQLQSQELVFDGPGWQVGVRLDATFDKGFQVRDPREEERAVQAGVALLF